MLNQKTLNFLKQLSLNNNKPWFDENREVYQEAKLDFEKLVQTLIEEISNFDKLGVLTPKECLFRINRDTRFSKNKSPYKNNFGAAISRTGKKNSFLAYYLHIQPGQSFLGGGIYMADTKTVNKFRDYILEYPKQFLSVIEDKNFIKHFNVLEGEKLKTHPKGYDKDLPLIEYLKMKSFIAVRNFTDKEVTSEDFILKVIELCHAMKPFLDLIQKSGIS